jgi:CelD/BcsL family acetyltransferase involved in cellulose biosynthesis
MLGESDYKKAIRATKKQKYKRRWHYASNIEKNGTPFLAEVKIDEKIAAFMCGYVNEDDGIIYVPRLAIDDRFARYSPGVCLINSTVKYMYENTAYRVLDLGTGNESYKLSLGGELYQLFNFEVEL